MPGLLCFYTAAGYERTQNIASVLFPRLHALGKFFEELPLFFGQRFRRDYPQSYHLVAPAEAVQAGDAFIFKTEYFAGLAAGRHL